ncbi:Uu.00g034180.m01.CDS01 [Anthostomella pinea]|uniref:Uu.00g034180.m01.CDS01 n=1 Tax=Anthostomella pinea TaxID=933095 RepID=A0AAI8YDB3_9PEZI|nr:Uu.00g034180.m01.CDS01 [Anthostomella pinea]
MAISVDEAKAIADRLESLINDPHVSGAALDDDTRRRLREGGLKLSLLMEAPGDTIHRISNTPLQLAIDRIGVETHLFEIMAEAEGSVFTNGELASKTNVDPVLMKRLLRYYQSCGMLSQPSDDSYSSNNITKALASTGGQSGINYFFEMVSPSFMAFPSFLRENGYRNPTDPNHCPWHLGHRTDLSPFPWLQTHPEHFGYFLPWMAA